MRKKLGGYGQGERAGKRPGRGVSVKIAEYAHRAGRVRLLNYQGSAGEHFSIAPLMS
jgi:hypothetical protein